MAPAPKLTWAQRNALRKQYKKQKLEKKLVKCAESSTKSQAPSQSEESKPKCYSTISIAVPGSILNNAHCPELKTYLAGQIARAACIYKIDEVVVYNDLSDTPTDGIVPPKNSAWRSCVFLGRILQYLECPQYLRKQLFPIHKDLEFAGLLNPLDAPHHLRKDDECPYREGVITNKPSKSGKGSYANIGLLRDAHVDKNLPAGMRVTVKLHPQAEGSKKVKGTVVSPTVPRAEAGLYWGYNIRLAGSPKSVLSECPYAGGYDLVIGTSDRGEPVDAVPLGNDFEHCVVFFGGVEGLEAALESDDTRVSSFFHRYVNTCPSQGSRTIRTEEAILISLSLLSAKLLD